MKRLTVVLLAGALAALMLQPISAKVNTNSSNNTLWADGGMPIPPVPPNSNFVADGGMPIPPVPPNFQLAGGGQSA